MQSVVLLSLVVLALAQYPTAPQYGVYNSNYYGGYGSSPRMFYQQQYAMQQQPYYSSSYNSYYPYNNNYNNYYGGYGGYNSYSSYGSNSYAQPSSNYLGMHNDGNGNLRIGNDLAALYITCNGRGCPVRG